MASAKHSCSEMFTSDVCKKCTLLDMKQKNYNNKFISDQEWASVAKALGSTSKYFVCLSYFFSSSLIAIDAISACDSNWIVEYLFYAHFSIPVLTSMSFEAFVLIGFYSHKDKMIY